MARVIVTDGETRAALAAVRALGRSGHEVFVTAARLPALASVSRWARRSAIVPSPLQSPETAVARLAELARTWEADVLLPVTDPTTSLMLGARSRLGSTVVAGPDAAAYTALADKASLITRARSVGLATPRSVEVGRAAELPAAVEEIGYPCVVKPHRSVVRDGAIQRSFPVCQVAHHREWGAAFPASAFPVLVQERIVGPGEGVFLLMDHGQRVAAFAHQRLREKPPWGGVSVYSESIALQPELLEACERLLAGVCWHGVAMVELKRRAKTGTSYLMEVNGRLWGSLQLALDSGVDFPTLLVRLALGEVVAPVNVYRVGVRSRWFWGDLDHLLTRFRRAREVLALDPGAPSRLGVLRDFLRFSRPGERFDVWDATDRRPFIRETIDWLSGRNP
ncbi:MAG TPA: ATP-grasp domain-containing protein [Gemmatimonadales bacterium]|nr:ATP-grasp domain-containing protein [Gemmatimonadales bacterium]